MYIHRLYDKVYKRLGWEPKEGEDNLVTLLRGNVIGLLVKNKKPEVLEEARRRMQVALDSSEFSIAPDLLSAIYEAVISSGEEKDFRIIQQRFRYFFLVFIVSCSFLLPIFIISY